MLLKRIALTIFTILAPIPGFSFETGKAPCRIISLAPSITESLYSLGVEDRVAGITLYCPPGTTHKEVIGTLWEPNIEKIVSLSPDLVVASMENNRKGSVELLQKLGIRVVVLGSDRDFKDICANFSTLGRMVGRDREAAAIIRSAQERIEKVRARVKSSSGRPPRIFWEVGAKPLFTISKKSFVNEYTSCAGGVNIFDDLTSRYAQISREEVVRRDPDVIIMVTMGDVTAEERHYWENFPSMRAVRNNRLHVVEVSNIFTPTPLTFARGVEIIADILHPEKPKTEAKRE